jgi:glycosyl hydrolase family 35
LKPPIPSLKLNRGIWLSAIISAACVCALPSIAQKSAPPPDVEIISVQGYPELRVEGRPFFVHAAEFSYYRVPPDLWSHSLDRFRELGINTIDLRIPWNWHEIREGEFDFDGHTNPRRDLRGLLKMTAEKGFYIIARPGPAAVDSWKNDGSPEWLPSANADQSLRELNLWLAAFARELAPYGSTKTAAAPASSESKLASEEKSPDRLLFIFLNNLPSNGAQFSQTLRDALNKSGIDPHFAITESRAENGLHPANTNSAISLTGDWYMTHSNRAAVADPKAGGVRVTDQDAQNLAFLAQNLRTQTDFPAMLAGFQAGWPTPSDDAGPPRSASSNTLLATRWLMAQGVAGIEYSPLQDSLTPPGYQTAGASREFRWNAALDLSAEKQDRSLSVARNGKFLETWGEFLASSHPRAGIGLIDWTIALSHADEISPAQKTEATAQSYSMFKRIERVALFAGLPIELVSPGNQSSELLLHNSFLLLAIPDSLRGKVFLPPATQTALIEYVRNGGVLFCNPERPQGAVFDEALNNTTPRQATDGQRVTSLGRGRIVEWSKDFYSWIQDPDESFADSFAREESHWATAALQNAGQIANFRAPVTQSQENQTTLLVNELVANEASGMLAGMKSDCGSHPSCAEGLLSVLNWSGSAEIQETLKVLPPTIDARVAMESDYIELPVDVPARESLMLPLNFPLCSRDALSKDCSDRVVAAGAELLGATRTGKILELTLYAPTAATVILHLRSAPTGADLPNMLPPGARNTSADPPKPPRRVRDLGAPPELGPTGEPVLVIGDASFPERTLHGTYDKTSGNFRVIVPRGAAPTFPRILRVHLSYDPDLPEVAKPAKQHGNGYRFAVEDAVRLPLNDGKSLLSQPPIILLDKDRSGQFIIESENLDDSSLTLQAAASGATQGSVSMRMTNEANDIETMKLRASGNGSTPETNREGLLAGMLNLSGGHMPDRSSILNFLIAESDVPVHYEYDFERSGSKHWVLENKRLRVMFLPAVGGEISALVDKLSGTNLTTTVGGLRDLLRVHRNLGTSIESQLLDPTLNVSYSAEWTSKDGAGILMKAHWPTGAPIVGEISKTVRMISKDGTDVIETEYLLHPEPSSNGNNFPQQPRTESASFVTAFSVPAIADQREGTQFCWLPAATPAPADATTTVKADSAHCAPFALNGNEIQIPADAARLEIRTTDRPTLAVEWTAGRVTIQQKLYSARILLEFPARLPANSSTNAAADLSYVVRYIVERTP